MLSGSLNAPIGDSAIPTLDEAVTATVVERVTQLEGSQGVGGRYFKFRNNVQA